MKITGVTSFSENGKFNSIWKKCIKKKNST